MKFWSILAGRGHKLLEGRDRALVISVLHSAWYSTWHRRRSGNTPPFIPVALAELGGLAGLGAPGLL